MLVEARIFKSRCGQGWFQLRPLSLASRWPSAPVSSPHLTSGYVDAIPLMFSFISFILPLTSVTSWFITCDCHFCIYSHLHAACTSTFLSKWIAL